MRKILLLLMGLAAAVSFSSCIVAQVGHPSAVYFGAYGSSTGVTSNPKYSPKPSDRKGEACATSIFGAVAVGDASVRKAAAKGGITKVSSVSHVSKKQMLFMQDWCVVVTGE